MSALHGKSGWFQRYQAALREHLRPGTPSSPLLAESLGRQAVALGLEALDLLKAHEQALAAVRAQPGGTARVRAAATKRANRFLAEAAIPIEKTHRAARETDVLINRLNRSLRARATQSSATKRRLERSVVQRRKAEDNLKRSRDHQARLLEEASRLQAHWRQLTHAGLSSQENKRQQASRHLQDEIAQSLLGIHVRLLSLRQAIAGSAARLRLEIGVTQRLVQHSTRKIHRLAKEFGLEQKA